MFTEDPKLAFSQRRETEKSERAEAQSLSLSDLSVSSRPPSALRADPALPFLDMVWFPSQMAEFLNHRVLPSVWPGQAVSAVTIEDMTYTAGKWCEILYALQFGDSTSGQSQWIIVTFAKVDKLEEIYRRHYGGETPARPTPSPVVFLPAYGCLVEFFPRDWGLPCLAWAMEPKEVASFLSQGSPEAERSPQLPTVEVLTYRLHQRCVLQYVLEAPAGTEPQAVIGKMYKSGARAVHAAQVLNRLYPQATACGLILPKPLRVIEEWGLLLMERVPGTQIKLVGTQEGAPQQLKAVIGLAAAALASLHRFHFESQEVRSWQTRVEQLRAHVASLHLVAPQLAQQTNTLLEQIARLGARSPAAACTFVHGDFSLGQLLLEKGQMAVIDFDQACLGDPAIDVGNFMARLHKRAVAKARNEFRQLATYFLSEYQARLPEHRVADRVHLFLSASLIRKALHAFEGWPYDYGQAGADSLPALLLQEAATCLAGTSDK